MVTTRRQSKDFEPVELPLVRRRKRKQSNPAVLPPSTAHLLNQPSTKRRKKVKSTAKAEKSHVPAGTTPTTLSDAPPSLKTSTAVALASVRAAGDAHKQELRGKDVVQAKPSHTDVTCRRLSAETDLAKESVSSDNEPAQRPHLAASRDADDEDADSRYALGSRRKAKTEKAAAPSLRRTAELEFEEDGLEEVDKAKAVLADASRRISQSSNKRNAPTNTVKSNVTDPEVASQTNGLSKGMPEPTKATGLSGVPSRTVMFTVAEAIATLSLYKDGTMSVPTEVDVQSRQPCEPLPTGEFLSYPVRSSYHLGALGRYGINSTPSLPFSLIVPLSEHSLVQHTTSDISTAEPSRHGLGFSSALPVRPQAPAVRRSNNYCFTWGKYRGRRMDSVPITYLRSIFHSDEYHADSKLQQAFTDLYPKGLYESEAESYTFEKGGFKGRRLDEVPKSYVWGLLRKMNEGGTVGGKKGRGRLERALESWEKRQLDLTRD